MEHGADCDAVRARPSAGPCHRPWGHWCLHIAVANWAPGRLPPTSTHLSALPRSVPWARPSYWASCPHLSRRCSPATQAWLSPGACLPCLPAPAQPALCRRGPGLQRKAALRRRPGAASPSPPRLLLALAPHVSPPSLPQSPVLVGPVLGDPARRTRVLWCVLTCPPPASAASSCLGLGGLGWEPVLLWAWHPRASPVWAPHRDPEVTPPCDDRLVTARPRWLTHEGWD